jgi:hypothetical protein
MTIRSESLLTTKRPNFTWACRVRAKVQALPRGTVLMGVAAEQANLATAILEAAR